MVRHADMRERKQAYLIKVRAELQGLAKQGLVMGGDACSSILLLKGELSSQEKTGAPLLSGKDGQALRKGLVALGYAPEDWCALSILLDDHITPVSQLLLREAVCALDPQTVLALDDISAQTLRETYADELTNIEDFHVAMLEPGLVAHVLGMRVMNLGGFSAALADAHRKQFVWACLKRVPPLGEPY